MTLPGARPYALVRRMFAIGPAPGPVPVVSVMAPERRSPTTEAVTRPPHFVPMAHPGSTVRAPSPRVLILQPCLQAHSEKLNARPMSTPEANTPSPTSGPGQSGHANRRALIKGAAWSVPIIALAVSAPAASASTTPAQPPKAADSPHQVFFSGQDANASGAGRLTSRWNINVQTAGYPASPDAPYAFAVRTDVIDASGAIIATHTDDGIVVPAAYGGTGTVTRAFAQLPRGTVTVRWTILSALDGQGRNMPLTPWSPLSPYEKQGTVTVA